MNTRPALVSAAAVTAMIVLSAAGCSVAPATTAEPRALTMLHIDGGLGGEPAVQWFIDAVAERSAGAITVDVTTDCCGKDVDLEERLVESIANGEAELGWVGTRVFGELGANDLAGLTAPFAIDGYDLMEQAITSEAAAKSIAALDVGVDGLAVMPGLLRYPLAAATPIVSTVDWANTTIASFHSAQNAEALRMLGANPLDVTFEERDQGIYDGDIAALENSLVLHDNGWEENLPYATVDLPLWGRTSALIASPDGLTADDRAVVLAAAADVAARTDELRALQEDAMRQACTDGARFALAEAEIDTMRAAVKPIWDDLAADPESAPLLGAVLSLRVGNTAEVPAIPEGCTGAAVSQEAAESDDPAVLNGRFQTVRYTVEQLVSAGIPQSEAESAAARFTMIFADGDFELIAEHEDGIFGCDGEYTVAGDELTVDHFPGGDCGPGGLYFTTRFTVDDAALTFFEFDAPVDGDEYLFASAPLERVE